MDPPKQLRSQSLKVRLQRTLFLLVQEDTGLANLAYLALTLYLGSTISSILYWLGLALWLLFVVHLWGASFERRDSKLLVRNGQFAHTREFSADGVEIASGKYDIIKPLKGAGMMSHYPLVIVIVDRATGFNIGVLATAVPGRRSRAKLWDEATFRLQKRRGARNAYCATKLP